MPPEDAPVRAASPGRPKDLGKAQAILDAAKQLFLEHGFERVSMDQIAATAGVSKLTVYNHYGDKERLFSEAVRTFCAQNVPESLFRDDPAKPLDACLLEIAQRFFDCISAPEAIAGHRMMCTPQMAASPTAHLFWASGPQHIQDGLATLLQRRAERGQLALPEPQRAAAQFFALLKGDAHSRMVLGCCDFDQADIQAHLQASVNMFLRAYRPDPSPR